MERFCICGGGSLGHVIAGFLSARGNVEVNVLTQQPARWKRELLISTPEGTTLNGKLRTVSNQPEEALSGASVVLLCLPGFAIKEQLVRIRPHVAPGTFLGSVFSSTGFFFEALALFGEDIPLWGFQRVPFIARTEEYGCRARLLGYKSGHRIAVEHCTEAEKERFRARIQELFAAPVQLLKNYYEASFTNSNPILHPSRLYTLFGDWTPAVHFDRCPMFYEEWTDEASDVLIRLDEELFSLLAELPVSPDFLMPILPYYESTDAASLTRKIRSIESFKGIASPMVQTAEGWQPDLASRYFQEDFMYGLRYIHQEAHRLGIHVPLTDRVFEWGMHLSQTVL